MRSRTGFTLIEVLIVIGIMALLLSLAVAAGIQMRKGSQAEETRSTVQQLGGIVTEYQAQTTMVPGQTTKGGMGAQPGMGWPVIDGITPANTPQKRCAAFYYVVYGNPTTREMVASVNPKFRVVYRPTPQSPATVKMSDDTDVHMFVDSWEQPLDYAAEAGHGGLFGNPTAGMPLQKRPYFASAGPDKLWGTINTETNQPAATDANGDKQPDAADNIYGFEQK